MMGTKEIYHVTFGSRLPCERVSFLRIRLQTWNSPSAPRSGLDRARSA